VPTDRQADVIVIDHDRCVGHARCMAEAPAVFSNDDVTGQAYVLDGADLAAERKAIETAAFVCPEGAITYAPAEASSADLNRPEAAHQGPAQPRADVH
jgi:ferredoxin